MKRFADMNIEPPGRLMVGDKIKIARVLNCPIVVHAYHRDASKYPQNRSGQCMTLQIEMNGVRHIIFTGSDVLAEMIEQVPQEDFPFETTIVKNGDHYEFT